MKLNCFVLLYWFSTILSAAVAVFPLLKYSFTTFTFITTYKNNFG